LFVTNINFLLLRYTIIYY